MTSDGHNPANREDQYDEYHPENLRALLEDRFKVMDQAQLKGGKRHIFVARRNG